MFSRSANSLLVIAGVASAVERVYPMILATVGNSGDVAIFAVAMRVIQLGMFGQDLGIFMYSQPLAAALVGGVATQASAAIARRIRLVDAECALPVAAPFLLAPRQFDELEARRVGHEGVSKGR